MSNEMEAKAPATFKEFLAEFKETCDTVRYVFRLTDSPDARTWLYRKYFLVVVLILMSMFQPRVTGMIFKGVVNNNANRIILSVALLGALMLFEKLVALLYWRAHEYLFGLSTGNLYVRITERFFEKSPGQHRHVKSLNYESVNKGKDKAFDMHVNQVPELAEATLTIVIAYALVWTVSPFGGIVLGIAMCINIAWSIYLNYLVAVVCTPIERDFSRFRRFFAEVFRLFERVYVSNRKQFEVERITQRWQDLAVRDRTFWLRHGKHATAMDMVMVLAALIVIGRESLHSIVNDQGAGAVAVLYPLFAWSRQIIGDIWRIRHTERRIYESVSSVRVMRETLDIVPDVVDSENARTLDAEHALTLAFENISYSYPHSNGTIQNVSFSVCPGEKIALIGPTGSGKSTIEYLAMRFMDPTSGRVCINGRDIREYQSGSRLNAIGYIPQKPLIFDGTVRENLLYGVSPHEGCVWTDAELLELMNDLAIDFGVRPEGENPLDIIVGRDGVQLSGGQAQRLAIGAAVIKQPKLLIVDEATSALDSSTETQTLEGLRKWINGSGMLVVAHRLSTVRDADRIIVLANGKIEAVGTSFDELVGSSETFRKLIAHQDHLLG
ncbi:ABC transporter ATP-binding protein [Candidatus Campbellbacteria bacterium]|nr:MAG: ABC transporter ATP-binding protein [Candidatus Campbellbacteria bacterium]